jgi:hypothetical protein
MFKKGAFWMVAFCLVLFGPDAGIPGDDAAGKEPQFSKQKTDLDSMLGRLESFVNNVDTRKIITIEDDADINRLLEECPEKLNEMDEEVSKNPQLKQQFNQFLMAHQRNVKALHSKLTSIESQAKAGKIVPDRSLLLSFSSADMQKYKSFLSAEGLSRVKQMYPEIFNKAPSPEPAPEAPGMMSGPKLECSAGESYGAPTYAAAAGVDCTHNWKICKNGCNSATFKWACRAKCYLIYIGCCLSQYI